MKKYIAPEISKMFITACDIITASGEGNFMDFDTDGITVNAADYFS